MFQQWVRLASEYKWQALGVATCGLEPHGREESIGTTRPDQARGWSISRRVDQSAPIEVLADEVVGRTLNPLPSHDFGTLAHRGVPLAHLCHRGVPDQIVAQRPESHSAQGFSAI